MEELKETKMQRLLGVEWKVHDVGFALCPRPLIIIYRRAHWWVFSY